MKRSCVFLGIFFLILQQFEALHTFPEMDAAIEKMRTALVKRSNHLEEEDNFFDILSTILKCVTHPRELICSKDDSDLNDCVRPLEIVFSRISGTRFEGFVEMMLKTMISARNYICNAQFKDLFEALSPCVNYDENSYSICWNNNSTESLEDITNAKEEYCKAFQHNAECTLNVATINCENPSTRKVLSEMYDAFFIAPCYD